MTFPATCWEDAYRTQVEAVRELRAENAELRATLELVMAADERAVDAWRAAHPGTALVWPDRAALVAWLLEQHAALRVEVNRLGRKNLPTTHEHHQPHPVAPRS